MALEAGTADEECTEAMKDDCLLDWSSQLDQPSFLFTSRNMGPFAPNVIFLLRPSGPPFQERSEGILGSGPGWSIVPLCLKNYKEKNSI